MRMSLLLRRIHLYLALFLAPWILMYTASTFAMNHREEGGTPPKFVLERELTYSGEMPDGATPRQIALQVLGALEMDGAHTIARGATAEKVVIQRQLPVNPRRITFTASDKKITVERMEFRTGAFLERMHRRRGYQHDYWLEDLWAGSVDLTIAALVALALSGLWMWWEMKATRRWGALALGAGCALFALFLGVM